VFSTEGEARLMMRSIISQDGIQVWYRVHRHDNRRTLARLLRMGMEEMQPKPANYMDMLI
jgi:hypothetical protein